MEISDLIESYYREKCKNLKQEIMMGFILAETQARYILTDEKQDIPHPWEYYPELFGEEKEQHNRQQEVNRLESYKEARRSYITEFNKRRQQGQ